MKNIIVRSLEKVYITGDIQVKALENINLKIGEGEFVAIVGSSGSGKTTLLNMLGGLDTPTNGSIEIDGQNIVFMEQEKLAVFRRRSIGFVFQKYNLIPVLNVYGNIVFPLYLDNREVDKSFLDRIMTILNIKEKMDYKPDMLSGGQQQRVALARALITKPAVILADEPTGNLDSKTSETVVKLLRSMVDEFHQTIVMVTHDKHAAESADRIIEIQDGRIIGVTYEGKKA